MSAEKKSPAAERQIPAEQPKPKMPAVIINELEKNRKLTTEQLNQAVDIITQNMSDVAGELKIGMEMIFKETLMMFGQAFAKFLLEEHGKLKEMLEQNCPEALRERLAELVLEVEQQVGEDPPNHGENMEINPPQGGDQNVILPQDNGENHGADIQFPPNVAVPPPGFPRNDQNIGQNIQNNGQNIDQNLPNNGQNIGQNAPANGHNIGQNAREQGQNNGHNRGGYMPRGGRGGRDWRRGGSNRAWKAQFYYAARQMYNSGMFGGPGGRGNGNYRNQRGRGGRNGRGGRMPY